MQPHADTGRDLGRATMVRAFALGATLAVGLVMVAWLLGAVASELEVFLFGGAAAAIAAGAVALWITGLFLAAGSRDGLPVDGAILAGRLQALLAAAFGVKLAVIVTAVLLLQQAGVKFEATATFCVTFAAASLVSQLTTAGSLSRSFGRRPRPLSQASDTAGGSEQNPTNPS